MKCHEGPDYTIAPRRQITLANAPSFPRRELVSSEERHFSYDHSDRDGSRDGRQGRLHRPDGDDPARRRQNGGCVDG